MYKPNFDSNKRVETRLAAEAHGDGVGLDELLSNEIQFRKRFPWIWRLTLYGPFVVSFALLVGLMLYAGWEFTSRVVLTTSMALWLFGRFMILSGTGGSLNDFEGSLSAFQLFTLITYLDVMVALMLAFHIGFLFRMPVVGPRVAALVADGHFILDSNPWMRRTTYMGLIAFVGFPLAATGSVGGSIFGRLLGMDRLSTFVCIVIGSVIGNGVMYWFSDVLGNYIDKDHWVVKYGGMLIILLLVIVLERRYQHLRKRFVEKRGDSDSPEELP